MLYFCTYFDRHYQPRGLALLHSLRQHCGEFRLWVLCLDEQCYAALASLQLPELSLLRLADLERDTPALLAARANRSPIEYYFTCTPALPWYILRHCPEVDLLFYIDADMYFFGSPAPIIAEISTHSIAIIEHRYPAYLRDMEQYGRYNVGLLAFRRDAQGLACLQWWLEQCIEWCYDRLEGERYADQKYLERWPQRFENLIVLDHSGVNVAPWNMMNYTFSLADGQVYVDDEPLVLFHFHGFKQKQPWLFDTHTARYNTRPCRVTRAYVFRPYIAALLAATNATQIPQGVRQRPARRRLGLVRSALRIGHYIKGIVLGQYLLAPGHWLRKLARRHTSPLVSAEWLLWASLLWQSLAVA